MTPCLAAGGHLCVHLVSSADASGPVGLESDDGESRQGLQMGRQLWASRDHGSFDASLNAVWAPASIGAGPGVSRWFSFFWITVENVNHKVAALPTAAVWGHAACESQARLSRAVLHMSV